MREIRLHGIGGMGTVKAGEILVHAHVRDGKYGNSTPFFGFERQGAPVKSFVRLGDEKIRAKNQVYNPNCVIILDPSLLVSAPVFEGLAEESVVVLNTRERDATHVITDKNVRRIAYLDATSMAIEMIGRAIPNTIMLGAFCRATEWVNKDVVEEVVKEMFGEKNAEAFNRAYNEVSIHDFEKEAVL